MPRDTDINMSDVDYFRMYSVTNTDIFTLRERSRTASIHRHIAPAPPDRTCLMADVLKFTLAAFIFFISLQVKKVAFISSDSIGLSVEGNDLFTNRETFTISSL